MAKVSVIVPIYKVENYMLKCIDSILSQTLTDLEIILVDDGSPDHCGEICDEYEAKDSRVKVIHKKNGGLSDARNAGLVIATGEYIGFVDSDDYITPEMFKLLVELCEKNHTKIAGCDLAYVYDNSSKKEIRSTYEEKVFISQDFFKKMLDVKCFLRTGVWNKLYKAELFKTVRFPNGKLFEDVGTMYKLIFQVDRISYASVPCYLYLKHRAGAITSGKYSEKEYDRLEMNTNMVEYIRDYQPELLNTAMGYRAINCNLSIVNSMINSKIKDIQMIELIRKDTYKNFKYVIKSEQAAIKKIQVFIMAVNFNLYKALYSIIK